MRGKRSKQYRKLMQQYGLSFGFREPYQVLVDADVLKDADRFKMDLIGGLERTLHGQVKPMITQCSMRHLYASSSEPGMSFLIDKAKLFERRRCNHLPEDYPEPLSTAECISSVVDPKDAKSNKHRYVVASQDLETRKKMRAVKGVPLCYINRSVMIMEPMAGSSAEVREREEKSKFRDGLRRGAGRDSGEKRKRDDEGGEEGASKKKKTSKGPKGPNPLAVKKAKKKPENEGSGAPEKKEKSNDTQADGADAGGANDGASEPDIKRKRRRKHTSAAVGGGATESDEKMADDQEAMELED